MQTDPNWANFLYNPDTKQVRPSNIIEWTFIFFFRSVNFLDLFESLRIIKEYSAIDNETLIIIIQLDFNFLQLGLLDFGATREYRPFFVNNYFKIIDGAAKGDREQILEYSRKLGFLTGYESKVIHSIFNFLDL